MVKVWIIMRSDGEYCDRYETPIRYCTSEADAMAAIGLIAVESQRDSPPEWLGYSEEVHAQYKANCLALGHVDPGGSFGDNYFITGPVELWAGEHVAPLLKSWERPPLPKSPPHAPSLPPEPSLQERLRQIELMAIVQRDIVMLQSGEA